MASSVLTYDGQVVTDQDVGDGRLLADIGQEVEYLRLNRDIQCGDRFVERAPEPCTCGAYPGGAAAK
jgi:hypothetical protein